MKRGIDPQSHSHARSELHTLLAGSDHVGASDAELYGRLFDLGHESEYATDHDLQREDVEPLLDATAGLVDRLRRLA